jgi:hypothetical protein
MPERVLADVLANDPAPFFVFPSVRMDQGITYRQHGGLVLEVTRPGYVPVNDFDHYDRDLVHFTVANDGEKRDLVLRVNELFAKIFRGSNHGPAQ